MTPRFRVVPASYLYLRRDDHVLLQRRQNTGFRDGFWAAGAAGHVEAGESALEAARREAQEELGIDVERAAIIPLCAMHRTAGDGNPVEERMDLFFECTRWSGTPRILEPRKAAELLWVPVDDLPHPTVPHERVVLEALASGDLPAILSYGFDAQER